MPKKSLFKTCSKCGESKPLSQYPKYADKRRPHLPAQHRADCKSCRSRRAQAWAKANPRRHNENMAAYYARGAKEIQKNRKVRMYGLTPEEFDAVVAPGACYICGAPNDLHIDHCHASGQVRGQLCRSCNHGLGNFNDDIERLEMAIDYLKGKTWQANQHLRAGRNLS